MFIHHAIQQINDELSVS